MLLDSASASGTDEQLKAEHSVTRKRVLVADDHARILDAVAALLGKSFEVVGLVSDGKAALEATRKLEPDLAVLDISMPGMSGIEVARELKRCASRTRIVFLTVHQDTEILASCIAAGGMGYVVKERMDSDLIPAIHEALAGRRFVSRFTSEQPMQERER